MKGECALGKTDLKSPFAEPGMRLLILGVFAIAMAALEAIVVVYLRQLYYPRGFDFPLTLLSPYMVSLEWLREAATIVMLVAIGLLAGKNPLQKLAGFLYTFAIWDIFYYLWLKLLLDWPPSLLTWDVLFLIPVPWIGPVLAPVICSLIMILFAFLILYVQNSGHSLKITLSEWALLITGCLVILFTFMRDYSGIILREISLSGISDVSHNQHLWNALAQYRPVDFNWLLFAFGANFILLTLVLIFKRTR